jgi:mannose-6-phosphate isomerase-like protein (cupin superfamily)
MASFHHRKLPDHSTLLAGHTPRDDIGFQSPQLQIWYNHTDQSWIGAGERLHMHTHSDECFIVLRGALVVQIEGEHVRVGPREFCCFPRGLYHAILEAEPPLETLMIRAPSVDDKVYQD